MLPREIHHLRHFRFGYFVSENTTFADAVLVNVKHDAGCIFALLIEEALKHMHDEFHRRVIVIKQKNPIQIWPLGLRLRTRDDSRAGTVVAAIAAVVTAFSHPDRHSEGRFVKNSHGVSFPEHVPGCASAGRNWLRKPDSGTP
jgi:hypothetical protein